MVDAVEFEPKKLAESGKQNDQSMHIPSNALKSIHDCLWQGVSGVKIPGFGGAEHFLPIVVDSGGSVDASQQDPGVVKVEGVTMPSHIEEYVSQTRDNIGQAVSFLFQEFQTLKDAFSDPEKVLGTHIDDFLETFPGEILSFVNPDVLDRIDREHPPLEDQAGHSEALHEAMRGALTEHAEDIIASIREEIAPSAFYSAVQKAKERFGEDLVEDIHFTVERGGQPVSLRFHGQNVEDIFKNYSEGNLLGVSFGDTIPPRHELSRKKVSRVLLQMLGQISEVSQPPLIKGEMHSHSVSGVHRDDCPYEDIEEMESVDRAFAHQKFFSLIPILEAVSVLPYLSDALRSHASPFNERGMLNREVVELAKRKFLEDYVERRLFENPRSTVFPVRWDFGGASERPTDAIPGQKVDIVHFGKVRFIP